MFVLKQRKAPLEEEVVEARGGVEVEVRLVMRRSAFHVTMGTMTRDLAIASRQTMSRSMPWLAVRFSRKVVTRDGGAPRQSARQSASFSAKRMSKAGTWEYERKAS